MFDVCTTGDKTHIDTIFKFLSHTLQHIDACVKELEYLIDVYQVTHDAYIENL